MLKCLKTVSYHYGVSLTLHFFVPREQSKCSPIWSILGWVYAGQLSCKHKEINKRTISTTYYEIFTHIRNILPILRVIATCRLGGKSCWRSSSFSSRSSLNDVSTNDKQFITHVREINIFKMFAIVPQKVLARRCLALCSILSSTIPKFTIHIMQLKFICLYIF